MLFTSIEFVVFAALVILLYYIVPKRFQWILLLIANIWFYIQAGVFGAVFMAVTIAATYLAARLITANQEKYKAYLGANKESLTKDEKKALKKKAKRSQRIILVLCLIVTAGILIVLKYTNFFILSFTSFKTVDLILPMGISFYTFQSIGYLVDVYRGVYPAEKNPAKFALFISFFPQLMQGPISRWKDLTATLFGEHAFSWDVFETGLGRVIWGYFKKLVIADRAAIAVAAISSDVTGHPGAFVFLGMVLYSVQLYADFTGGIDITIGIAKCLGIDVTENFHRPYFSKNIAEYWRRWHITMSTWFKDYLFYPISMAKGVTKVSKWLKKNVSNGAGVRFPIYLSSIITWFMTGFWHGASWNYIVWGMLNCVVILVSEEFKPLYAKADNKLGYRKLKYYKVFEIIRTLFILELLQLLDHYKSLSVAFSAFVSLLTVHNWDAVITEGMWNIGLAAADYVVILAGVMIMLIVSMLSRSRPIVERLKSRSFALRYVLFLLLFLSIIVFGVYGIGYESSNFIYNQF